MCGHTSADIRIGIEYAINHARICAVVYTCYGAVCVDSVYGIVNVPVWL